MITTALTVVSISLLLAFIAVLTWKYRATHDAGFIWLGMAILVWPSLMGAMVPSIMHHLTGDYGVEYSQLSMMSGTVGLALQLVVVFFSTERNLGQKRPFRFQSQSEHASQLP